RNLTASDLVKQRALFAKGEIRAPCSFLHGAHSTLVVENIAYRIFTTRAKEPGATANRCRTKYLFSKADSITAAILKQSSFVIADTFPFFAIHAPVFIDEELAIRYGRTSQSILCVLYLTCSTSGLFHPLYFSSPRRRATTGENATHALLNRGKLRKFLLK